MVDFLVRVEAINMNSSMFDTDDLSTVRGGGYANLLVPDLVLDTLEGSPLGTIEKVFAGASQAAAVLYGASGTDRHAVEDYVRGVISGAVPLAGDSRRVSAILPHLCVTFGVTEIGPGRGDYVEARGRVLAIVRRRQLTSPTIDIGPRPAPDVRRPCAFDRVRGATTTVRKGTDSFPASASVADRRAFGRDLRQQVYRRIGADLPEPRRGGELPPFADDFHDLVSHPPPGLPPTLRSKMAVVKFDGNAFTKAREGAIEAASGKDRGIVEERDFSRLVAGRRADLLFALIDTLEADPRMFDRDGRLRFEMLMWGGDEAQFVLPAWKLFDALRVMFGHFADPAWTFRGRILTHGIGALVCNVKMPIATALDLVDSVLDSAKNAAKTVNGDQPDHVLAVQMIESVEPPAGTLAAYRRRFYGLGAGVDQIALDAAFARVGKPAVDRLADLGSLVTDPVAGLPKSQLFDVVAALRDGRAASTGDAEDALEKAVRRSHPGADAATVGKRKSLLDALKSDAFGMISGHPAFGPMRLAEMWELIRPFAGERGGR